MYLLSATSCSSCCCLFTVKTRRQKNYQRGSLNNEEVTDITPDVRLTLYNAGHNLGSSMAHLHIGNGLHNLLYTGAADDTHKNTF